MLNASLRPDFERLAAGTARLIHDPLPELASLPLATTEPVVVPSRDCLALRLGSERLSSTAADLVAFLNHLPRTPEDSWVQPTVGDTAIPADVRRLRDMSPLHHVDRLSGPVILARGEKDGALPPGEQEAFVDALERHGKTVSDVVYQGDGHFFSPANELDYFARVETLTA